LNQQRQKRNVVRNEIKKIKKEIEIEKEKEIEIEKEKEIEIEKEKEKEKIL
jgi:hypothetical protein